MALRSTNPKFISAIALVEKNTIIPKIAADYQIANTKSLKSVFRKPKAWGKTFAVGKIR